MYGIFKPGGLQLIADKYISVVSVGHDTLQFRITQEVCKYLTAAGAILIEEEGAETVYTYHPSFNDTSGNLCQIRRMLYRFSGHSHRFIPLGTIGQTAPFPG